ncbi:helix-turn-helix domain-containing protein [Micromonospora sp. NBC_01813]|uniref:helix-turn-helix domain-containing protein n=1 Tax=Micromonospora sp. NBC_01813 TaxID=2975988 RepID=UPI002DDC7B31|nr:helix-turn-helix domain-containing protein [Micromonospora sp. NBC_01813]WSA07146.1 helix-turn-helix domain-containing protein [Micromonospora sp. NBC_01813]
MPTSRPFMAERDGQEPTDLPSLLVTLRRSAGLTQERLAEAAGLSSRTVGNVERGRVVPDRLTIDRIATVLGPAAASQLSQAMANSVRNRVGAARSLELPAETGRFIGRVAEVGLLAEMAAAAIGLTGAAVGPAIVAVCGPAGVGKTRLAVRAAHRAAASHDVRGLLVDLRGTARLPHSPGTALGHLLRSLGVPEYRTPLSVLDRTTLLRSVMAGRRGVLVLDDAYAEDQVRPLLPASAGWLVIVTSRSGLAGLFGARWCSLGPLPGGVRVERADRADRIGGMANSEAAYRRLRPPERQLFRRLALLPPGDHPAMAAEPLTDLGPDETVLALDSLIEAGLLSDAPRPGSFRLYPAVRRQAAARLRQEENVDRWRATCERMRRLASES